MVVVVIGGIAVEGFFYACHAGIEGVFGIGAEGCVVYATSFVRGAVGVGGALLEANHVIDDDFGAEAAGAVFGYPAAGLEVAFYVDEITLPEELATDVGEAGECYQLVEFGGALAGALTRSPLAVGGDAEGGDRLTALGLFDFWLAGEIADEDYFVDAAHSIYR